MILYVLRKNINHKMQKWGVFTQLNLKLIKYINNVIIKTKCGKISSHVLKRVRNMGYIEIYCA